MLYLQNQCYNHFDPFFCNEAITVTKYAAIATLFPAITIIHEASHGLAAHLLYQNAKPRIVIGKFGLEASCFYNQQELSNTGKWLGKHNAKAIIAAAGPIAQVVASIALLYFFPGNIVSLFSLLQNALYSISALEKTDLTNDFIAIKYAKGNFAAGALIVTSVALGIFSSYSSIQHYIIPKS